ncbi:MAG: hypothetical protein Fur006_24860 [Coleofasciculaceae cyanobacterium]
MELRHNGNCVARSFGEAKNYELLTDHLKTFNQWLEDVKFNPSPSDRTPPDLAFMIGPSCPSLLQRKLELKNIQFIKSQIVPPPPPPPPPPTAVNINTADKASLIAAFKGTGIKQVTIDKLIQNRQRKFYRNLDGMVSDKLISTPVVRKKLQAKLDNGEICFQ